MQKLRGRRRLVANKMLKKFGAFFERLESSKSPLVYWLIAFLAIIFIRNFLEGLLEADHEILNINHYILDYTLAYALLFLSLLALLRLITKENSVRISKVLVILFVLLLIVPVIDFGASSGKGYEIKYLRGDVAYLSNNFVTYYSHGVSIGQRVEAFSFGILLLIYLFMKTRSYLKTVIGVFASYAILFLWSALPSVIYLLSNVVFGNPLTSSVNGPAGVFKKEIIDPYISYPVILLAVILLLIIELATVLFISDKKLFSSVRQTLRPIRIMHYAFLALFGLALGYSLSNPFEFEFHKFLFSFSFLVAAILVYQFACAVNDFFDRDLHTRIDAKDAKYSPKILQYLATVFLSLSLLLACELGQEVLVILLTFASVAFIYSAPPLRLKRYPIIASLTLATCALLIVLGGFAVFAKEKTITFFPSEIAIMLVIVYTLGTNYKDLKDVRSDKKDKVYTLPVLLGEKYGRIAITLLTAISFPLVPLILNLLPLLLPAIIASILSVVIIKKNLNEKYFRAMHLMYFIIVAYFIIV